MYIRSLLIDRYFSTGAHVMTIVLFASPELALPLEIARSVLSRVHGCPFGIDWHLSMGPRVYP
jgi:hypothetical protein